MHVIQMWLLNNIIIFYSWFQEGFVKSFTNIQHFFTEYNIPNSIKIY